MALLSDDQIAAFHEQGFLQVRGLVGDDELRVLARDWERIVRGEVFVPNNKEISDLFFSPVLPDPK